MQPWTVNIDRLAGPRYRAIATAVADAARDGRLAPGDRLPTHRRLAADLGVSIGAVTRAYRLLAEWGVVSGEVGRGAYIRSLAREKVRYDAPGAEPRREIDLAHDVAVPVGEAEREILEHAFRAVGEGASLLASMRSSAVAGNTRAHRAACAWLATLGLEATTERVVLCAGVQHALLCTLAAAMRPGDTLLCEAMAYPGLRALATMLRLDLRPVAIDAGGVVPDALERACRETGARALACAPTGQTPTGSVMSGARRKRIGAIAEARDLLILEDDETTPLLPAPPTTLAAMFPDRVVYLAGTEMAVAPGLRVAIVLAPEALAGRISEAVRSTIWMVPAPVRDAMTLLIERGDAQRLVAMRRRELDARRDLAHRALAPEAPFRRGLHHAWLDLPDHWRPEAFARAAAEAGVLVETPEPYVVAGAAAPRAVRVCLGAEPDASRLERGFEVVGRLLRG